MNLVEIFLDHASMRLTAEDSYALLFYPVNSRTELSKLRETSSTVTLAKQALATKGKAKEARLKESWQRKQG